MKAQELRIGNLIKDEENTPYQVEVEDIENLNYYEKYKETMFPIPLTEEWLMKFGFIKTNHTHSDGSVSIGVFKNKKVVIEHNDGSLNYLFCVIQVGSSVRYDYLTSLKYIHQLQNLYFALTGEELTIKE